MSDGNQIVQAAGEVELRQEDAAKTQALEGIVEGLPEKQQQALTLIAEGQPIREAAKNAGINRGTLYRWIKADPHFRAAYNAWQLEQRESARAGLLKAAEAAVAKLAKSVETDGNLAFRLVKEMGLMAWPGVLRSEPGEVEQQMQIEALESENRLDGRHFKRLIEKIRIRRNLEQVTQPQNEDDDEFEDDEEEEVDRAPGRPFQRGFEQVEGRLEASGKTSEEDLAAPVADPPQAVAQPAKPAPSPVARQAPRKERLSDVETRIG